MYTVYVIVSDQKLRYIGQTNNFSRRLDERNKLSEGKYNSIWTKRWTDWKTLLREDYPSRAEALKREKFLKSWKWREYLDSLQGS